MTGRNYTKERELAKAFREGREAGMEEAAEIAESRDTKERENEYWTVDCNEKSARDELALEIAAAIRARIKD